MNDHTDVEELTELARRAAERAYAPYSRFRVGAVAVTPGGDRFTGANVENSAYGATICAEGNAISSAVAAGAREIDTVAVACIDAADAGYPCGNCRQLMVEFRVRRVVVDAPGGPRVHRLEELIPFGFRFD
jgi:cytidine deaminase